MPINPKYKKPKITSGDLKTPVIFFASDSSSPEPNEQGINILYKCFAEIYNPSMKDMEIINSRQKATKEAVTINIRDTKGEFLPTNKHKVQLDDYRYKDTVWEVIAVFPDVKNDAFVKIILGVTS